MSGAALFEHLDREVWIVTASGGRGGGLLATWVLQASLDERHPVLVAGIAPNHHTAQCIEAAGGLTAHLLRSEQTELALRFAAASGHDHDKLAGLQLLPPPLPVAGPRLADCLAWGAGPVFATLQTGDRNFYWVDLLRGETVSAGPPLRQRQLLTAADPATRMQLKADLERDIQLQQPWQQAWRAQLPADGRIG